MNADTDKITMDEVDSAEVDSVIESDDVADVPDELVDDVPMVSDYTGVDCDPWVPDGDPYADIESAAMKWYGDIDVVATDPENVRGLWAKIYDYIEDAPVLRLVKPYDRCAKDYPFEAAMVEDENKYPDSKCNTSSNTKPTITEFTCDTLINPGHCWGMNWTMGWEPHWSENNGKVVVNLFNPNNTYFIQGEGGYYLDIAKRQMIRFSGRIDGSALATNGRYLFFTTYDDSHQYSWPDRNYYIEGNKKYAFAYYDTEKREYGIAYKKGSVGGVSDVAANEKYVIMTLQDDLDVSGTHVVYTKIGEWDNWKPLKAYSDPSLDRVGRPFLHDHNVAFYNWDFVIQYCDLDIGTDSCKVVSRHKKEDKKTARNPVISADGTKIYYDESGETFADRTTTVIEVNISDINTPSFHVVAQHEKYMSVADIDERFLIVSKEIGIDTVTANEYPFYASCFYRFTDGKTFCLENDHDSDTSKNISKVDVKLWGKYLIYGNNYGSLVLRDMECYCDAYPDTCPYEEYSSKRSWKNLFGLFK